MVFVSAMVIELVSFGNKNFKSFLNIVLMIIYFVSGSNINFIGKIDFERCILFVIIFNNIIPYVIDKLVKAIKE